MSSLDPVRLEIFRSLFASIAEEMGATLMRTASSPNIKERRDYSCALFDGDGALIAQGEHMPVHLGSMPLSVEAAIESLSFQPGDIVILNDPYCGGTHLPDLTMIAPVYLDGEASPNFFVGNRAHHADVGGMSAGSMPLAREIYQEGVIVPPVKWVNQGIPNYDLQQLLLSNVRTPEEREEDLDAQRASINVGIARLFEICDRYGSNTITEFMRQIRQYSERLMKQELKNIPDGEYTATDYLDDDGISDSPVKIKCTVLVDDDQVTVDYSDSDPQVKGSLNAVFAITYSATVYCFRCLSHIDIPINAGCFKPLRVIAPEGLVVNAKPPAAVAGGNVETSQRIVDVVLRALAQAIPDRIPAASQGTMNNIAIGGMDTNNKPFGYYETVAGGMGARPSKPGVSGIHTHMTNTMNTPVEALEIAYPFRIGEYRIRDNSGGAGRYPGGDGILRSIELLTDVTISILSERRTRQPYGLHGGSPGKTGVNILIQNGQKKTLPGKCQLHIRSGDSILVQTPGGGGWGKAGTDE